MTILDTSAIVAAVDASHPLHRGVKRAFQNETESLTLSPFVLAEVDYLLAKRFGVDAEVAFLQEVALGAYRLAAFDGAMVSTALELVARYQDASIGLADASIAVLAAHTRTTRILTLDHRHFRMIRPLWGNAFTLLPADDAAG